MNDSCDMHYSEYKFENYKLKREPLRAADDDDDEHKSNWTNLFRRTSIAGFTRGACSTIKTWACEATERKSR